jgi:hypothetical protein
MKVLGIVFRRRPIWSVPVPSESLRMGKIQEAGTNGGVWMYNTETKAKMEIPAWPN